MAQSILVSLKKILNVAADDPSFDLDIVLHTNSVFSTLNQLGVGPDIGFMIEDDDSTWDEFIGADPRLNAVKTYTFLRVKILFDPPQTQALLTAFETQIKELEWRLSNMDTVSAEELAGFGVSLFGVSPFGI